MFLQKITSPYFRCSTKIQTKQNKYSKETKLSHSDSNMRLNNSKETVKNKQTN